MSNSSIIQNQQLAELIELAMEAHTSKKLKSKNTDLSLDWGKLKSLHFSLTAVSTIGMFLLTSIAWGCNVSRTITFLSI